MSHKYEKLEVLLYSYVLLWCSRQSGGDSESVFYIIRFRKSRYQKADTLVWCPISTAERSNELRDYPESGVDIRKRESTTGVKDPRLGILISELGVP